MLLLIYPFNQFLFILLGKNLLPSHLLGSGKEKPEKNYIVTTEGDHIPSCSEFRIFHVDVDYSELVECSLKVLQIACIVTFCEWVCMCVHVCVCSRQSVL